MGGGDDDGDVREEGGGGGRSVVRSAGGDVKVEDVNCSQGGDNISGTAEHLAAGVRWRSGCLCVLIARQIWLVIWR